MRRLSSLFALLLLLVGVFAFAEEVKMTNASIDPGAQGRVKFNHDRNHNTLFDIKVEHLAAPSSLTPAKSNYVVWIQRNGEAPQNMGMLTVNENLEGSFHGTTPLQQFNVIVTAEDNVKADSPSSMEVLRATVNNQ